MKIGFIGTGKIGSAIIKGLLNAKNSSQDIYVYDGGHKSAQKIAAEFNLRLVNSYTEFKDRKSVV